MTNIPEVLRMRRFRVQEIVWEAPEIFTLRLMPCEGEIALPFKAGQWVYLHLLHEDGTSWKAAFSIATAPSDEGPIELGIKIEGGFTKRASQLSLDTVVALQGPFGVFVLPDPLEASLVCIAGGIGIAPLRSMIRELVHRGGSTPIYLAYSNRYAESAAYLEEFQSLRQSYPCMKLLLTLTGEHPAGWKAHTGRLNATMLAPLLTETARTARFFICGPHPFMESICGILEAAGVEKKRVHQERFD